MGAYAVEEDKYYFLEDHKEVKNLFKKHQVIVGFNSKFYDEPILKRHGLMEYRHIHIDLREIVSKRQIQLNCKNESKSLDNMAKFFSLGSYKGELDYTLLNKESLSEEEYELIREYTLKDIEVTYKMFKHLCKFFESFKEFMNKYDVMTYKWLTSSISVYAYKVICHFTGLKLEYDDKEIREKFEGGFVAEPSVPEAHGNVYCLDFASLYPHIMVQANLFSYKCKCCKDEEKWSGNELFKVKGKYCSKKHGHIENVIYDIYLKRKELKKQKNPAELALKYVINTLYGLLGNSKFKSLFNYQSASDCTLIGRESIKLTRRKFKSAGYKILYSDTDSVYLQDVFNDKQRLLFVKDSIINTIKKKLPFNKETFDMDIDEEIKHIWFFEKNNRYLKKMYVYVNNKNRLTIKGIPIIKSDSSKIGLKIFDKYMREQVINGNIKFKFEDIKGWLHKEVKNDISIILRKFTVKDFKDYKKEFQLQAQISKKYGSGTIYLLENKKIGIGKNKKYCTIEEFNKHNLEFKDLIFDKFWSEMTFFSKIPKKRNMNNEMLTKWTNIK